MSEKEKKPKGQSIEIGVTRRQFLTGTGVVVGGAAIGSVALLAACGGETETETVTQTQTLTQTVTTTVAGPGAEVEGLISINVNDRDYALIVEPYWTLAFILRDRLGLFGLKNSCERGECGTCTVIVDGKAVYSCLMLAAEANGKRIQTVEGLSDGVGLHPIQQAFVDNDAMQCGFCIPGYIMSAKALLDENANPSRDEVREALSGHWCCCGNTKKIVQAVLSA
jgi:aerobic-type carbon monoxide dehydrogenase small subunit (CoxS/CutS family)